MTCLLLAACGGPPTAADAADAPDARVMPDAAPLDPVGSWNAAATPTADCSYGSLVGGAILDIAPAGLASLSVAIDGALLVVIDVADCMPTACHVEAREETAAGRVTYLLDFAGAEVYGVALSGPSCSIAVEGSRAP